MLSACGVEGVPDEQAPMEGQTGVEPAPQPAPTVAAASEAVESVEQPEAQNPTVDTSSAIETSTPNTTDQIANQQPAPAQPVPILDVPVIDLTGTSFYPEQEAGELIVLDGSNSTVTNSEIVSFKWEQIDNGAPVLTLINANTASAYFVTATEHSQVKLKFKLTVTAANGKTASTFFEY